MTLEYRLITKREGQAPRVRIYRTMAGAQRRLLLYGPEPWLFWRKGPDDLVCCDGNAGMCGCGGDTYSERTSLIRSQCPPLEYARIEQRRVSRWVPGVTGQQKGVPE